MSSLAPIIELSKYYYIHTYCSASPDFQQNEKIQVDLDVKSTLLQHEKDPEQWRINLSVGLADDTNDRNTPYDFFISITGFFTCPSTEEECGETLGKLAPLIYVNGSSLLYSMAREYVRNITSGGPYGQYLLPTFRFNPEDILPSEDE